MDTPTTGRGLFIAFEGGEGGGKSTQSSRLAQRLRDIGHKVTLTREPGGTTLGGQLRELLLHGEHVDPRAEALMFAADRAQHCATLIEPALADGHAVITDRFMDSSIAYQHAGRGLAVGTIRSLSMFASDQLVPDLTIVLDVDPSTAAARKATDRPDRMESAGEAFHAAVRACFLDLAASEPDRYLVLDAGMGRCSIHDEIWAAVQARLADRGTGIPMRGWLDSAG